MTSYFHNGAKNTLARYSDSGFYLLHKTGI